MAYNKAYGKKWRADPKNRQRTVAWNRESRLRYFGMTEADYATLVEKQHGLCAVCRRPERAVNGKNKKVSRLSVDHNHTTGHNRGLLCGACNRALGLLGDDVLRIDALAVYLEQYGSA